MRLHLGSYNDPQSGKEHDIFEFKLSDNFMALIKSDEARLDFREKFITFIEPYIGKPVNSARFTEEKDVWWEVRNS